MKESPAEQQSRKSGITTARAASDTNLILNTLKSAFTQDEQDIKK